MPEGRHGRPQRRHVDVKGPKGKLSRALPPRSTSRSTATSISVTSSRSEAATRARLQGLTRALIAAWSRAPPTATRKTLELVGTGYRAEIKGKTLNLALGFSHPINFPMPAGINRDDPRRFQGHHRQPDAAPTRS